MDGVEAQHPLTEVTLSELTNTQRRTRQAILTACRELLAEGVEPSMGDVAERALVGRATVYRYFPALKHLLFEASLQNAQYDIDAVLHETANLADPEERLDVVVTALYRRVSENEAAYRRLLHLSLEVVGDVSDERRLALRGAQRVRWLEETLARYRDQFDPASFEHLSHALSMTVGVEGFVALRDVLGLSAAEAEHVVRWTAIGLLRHALAESREVPPVGTLSDIG